MNTDIPSISSRLITWLTIPLLILTTIVFVYFYIFSIEKITKFFDNRLLASAKSIEHSLGIEDGELFVDIPSFSIELLSTDDKGNVNRGIGEAATASFTSSTSTTGNYTAGTDSWQIGAKKKFGNLSAKLTYTNSDSLLEKNDLEQTYLGLKYKFTGSLKNLAVSAEYTIYEYGKGNESKDKNELRTKLIYSF